MAELRFGIDRVSALEDWENAPDEMIADGQQGDRLGALALEVMRERVDEVVGVSDEDIRDAMRFSGLLIWLLGPSAILLLSRIAGLLLAAIAVQMLAEALVAFARLV